MKILSQYGRSPGRDSNRTKYKLEVSPVELRWPVSLHPSLCRVSLFDTPRKNIYTILTHDYNDVCDLYLLIFQFWNIYICRHHWCALRPSLQRVAALYNPNKMDVSNTEDPSNSYQHLVISFAADSLHLHTGEVKSTIFSFRNRVTARTYGAFNSPIGESQLFKLIQKLRLVCVVSSLLPSKQFHYLFFVPNRTDL
jgi:hypothetical protein